MKIFVLLFLFSLNAFGNNLLKPQVFPVSPSIPPPIVPTAFNIIGHIQSAAVDSRTCPGTKIDPRLSGGWVVVNGIEITIPCNTILQMPATSLTWADLFDLNIAPIGTLPATSGLALEDTISTNLSLPGYEIRIQGNIIKDTSGVSKHIAGLVFISQEALNVGQGYIKSIDYATGELCVSSNVPRGGITSQTESSTPCLSPDARVRINDPVGRFGKIHGGPGCSSLTGSNKCDVEESQYDKRFMADTDNPTIHSATGFPMCVPRVYPFGVDGDIDALCPQQNRPKQVGTTKCKNLPTTNGVAFPAFPAQTDGYCHSFVMDALSTNPAPAPGPCGTVGGITVPCTTRPDRQAPFEIGDYIDYSGTLLTDSYILDPIHVSPYYISAHTINAHIGIYTYPGSKPVYTMISTLLAGTNALPIQNIPQEATSRIKVEGFTTDPSSIVDIFAMDVDKVTGSVSDRLLASVNPSGPPVIGRVRFVPAAGAYSPPTRNIRIVSRTMCATRSAICFVAKALPSSNPAGLFANGLLAGQYNAPNFEYIFPENLFLGDPILPNNFQDLLFLSCGSGPLTTLSGMVNPPIVGPLDPAPWEQPMPAPSQCGGKLANQITIPVTQTPDNVTVINASWDNKQNKGLLTVTATSSLPNTTQNLQLYIQAVGTSGAKLAADPQPMQLVTNPTGAAPVGGFPCPSTSNPCWKYTANGTIMDPSHPKGDPSMPGNVYTSPTLVTVYSSRGGIGNITPTLICGVISNGSFLVSTC